MKKTISNIIQRSLDAFPDKPVILVGGFNFDLTDGNCGFSVLKHWMSDYNISAVLLAADSPTMSYLMIVCFVVFILIIF